MNRLGDKDGRTATSCRFELVAVKIGVMSLSDFERFASKKVPP